MGWIQNGVTSSSGWKTVSAIRVDPEETHRLLMKMSACQWVVVEVWGSVTRMIGFAWFTVGHLCAVSLRSDFLFITPESNGEAAHLKSNQRWGVALCCREIIDKHSALCCVSLPGVDIIMFVYFSTSRHCHALIKLSWRCCCDEGGYWHTCSQSDLHLR